MSALWPHVSCCSHRRVSNSMPRLQVSLLSPTCAPHMAYLVKAAPLRPPATFSYLSHAPQPPACTIHVGTHHARSATTRQEKCWYCSGGNPQSCRYRSSCMVLALFLNREPSFFLWSTLVNPNLKGTVVLIQPTVISCIINFVFLSSSGIQARRAEIY